VFEPERVLEAARASIASQGHVRAAFFWGVAWRQVADGLDRSVMAHLQLLMANLGVEFEAGTRLTLLLGDTHARANRIPEPRITSYCQSIEMLAGEFHVQTKLISQIRPFVVGDEPTASEREVFAAHRHQLLSGAVKLGFGNDASDAALRYFLVRWRERVPIAQKMAPSILLAADSAAQAFLLPDLPTLFIYTLPGRKVCKPWLVRNDGRASTNESAIDSPKDHGGCEKSVAVSA